MAGGHQIVYRLPYREILWNSYHARYQLSVHYAFVCELQQCVYVMRDDDPLLGRGPLQQLRVFCALQFYFLRNDEVEVRQAQLQTVDDSMVEVLVEQKTTKHSKTRVLSAYQLVTSGQYPFAKRLRV